MASLMADTVVSLKTDDGMCCLVLCRDLRGSRYGQETPLEQFVREGGFGKCSQYFSCTGDSDEA